MISLNLVVIWEMSVQIGRRQYRRRRFGEMSASPAVSENPCTFARLLLGPWEVFKLPRLS